jgi:dienelactone hydrolase
MKLRRTLIPLLLLPWLGCLADNATVAAARTAAPPAPPSAQVLRLFDYDARAPLALETVATRKKGTLTVQEITYASPRGGRVPATLIVPDGLGPFAGVLLLHGMPADRSEMLPEAEALAQRGAVTLAIDAPFARPGSSSEGLRFQPEDRDQQVQLIVDLRRGIDLLAARPDVDAKRLAYVGFSYGATMGGLLAGVEKRLKAYVFESGNAGLVHLYKVMNPERPQRLEKSVEVPWLAAMEPIESLHFVGLAAPARLLFQNGRADSLVPASIARELQEAASEPKTIQWYDSDHFLNEQAARDRRLWLTGQLGLAAPAPPE